MANGRLKRESNPIPGEIPGFLPQHESSVSGEFVVTGENNPYPTKVKNIHEITQRLDSLEEKIDKILDGTQPANVQLTGSIDRLYEQSSHVALTAGSVLEIVPITQTKNFREIRAVGFPTNPNSGLKLEVKNYTSNKISVISNLLIDFKDGQYKVGKTDIYSDVFSIQIVNPTQSNQDMARLIVIGVK